MIYIHDIQWAEVRGNEVTLYKNEATVPCLDNLDGPIPELTIETECVRGRKIVRDGKEIVLGMRKFHQDLLHIQYEAIDNLQRDYGNTLDRLSETQKKLESEKTLSRDLMQSIGNLTEYCEDSGFWMRLKWLLKGWKYEHKEEGEGQ